MAADPASGEMAQALGAAPASAAAQVVHALAEYGQACRENPDVCDADRRNMRVATELFRIESDRPRCAGKHTRPHRQLQQSEPAVGAA